MATIGQDHFTEASDVVLNSHTPDVGASWTLESVARWNIDSANDVARSSNGSLERAIKNDDIGADIMDVSALVQVSASNTRLAGVCGRMSSGSFGDQYEAYIKRNGTGATDVFLFKNVAGTRTQLGTSAGGGPTSGVAGTIKLLIRTGTQEIDIDGVAKVNTTEADSTLSGRQFAGIIGNGANSAAETLDDFLSESVSVGAPTGFPGVEQLMASGGWVGAVYA